MRRKYREPLEKIIEGLGYTKGGRLTVTATSVQELRWTVQQLQGEYERLRTDMNDLMDFLDVETFYPVQAPKHGVRRKKKEIKR